MNELAGIHPAVVTPFMGDGGFDAAAFERLLAFLFAAGVDGIYVGGTTGEGSAQPVRQRREVIDAAVRTAPAGKRVIAHVGAASLADALELARHAGRAGVAAISSLPPLGPYGFVEVREYYARLAAAAEVPLLLYHFPAFSQAVAELDQLLELCAIANVAGLKFTDFDLYKLGELRRAGCLVLNGRDEVLVAGLLMGANGGIGTFYNLLPDRFVAIRRLAAEGRWAEAREVQGEINGVIRAMAGYPLFPAVKAVLGWMGMDCGDCLPPRGVLSVQEREGLRRAMAQTCLAPALAR